MAGVKITDRDNGFRALVAKTKNVRPVTIRVGVNGNPHHDAGGFATLHGAAPHTPAAPIANDELGAIHEFGLGNNPERSFLRAWLDDEKLWLPELEKELDAADPRVPLAWAKRFGAFAVESVRARMRRGILPELKVDTILRKMNGDTPLIETEQLMKAVEFDVKEGK
jgi:hypothetical protein